MAFWTKVKETIKLANSRMFYIGRSSSGVNIDSENILNIDTVLACFRVLSESIASLPVDLYYKDANKKYKAVDHPLYNIIKMQPNADMTAYELKEWMMIDCLKYGIGVAQIIRDENGQVNQIYPMYARKTGYNARDNIYTYGDKDILKADEVLIIKFFFSNTMLGENVTNLAKDILGGAQAASDYANEFFANGTILSGTVEFPNEMSDETYNRLKSDWESANNGKGKRHRTPILEGGAKFNPIMLKHDEAQLIETRKLTRSLIAGIYRVPAHLINDLEKSTFSNIEHLDLGFVKHTLRPWMVKFEQRLWMSLLTDEEKKYYYFKFNTNDLLRGDLPSRYTAFGTGIQNGFLSPNDVREIEDLEDYDGGDNYICNGSMQSVLSIGSDKSESDKSNNMEDENNG